MITLCFLFLLLAICISSLEQCLLRSFALLKLGYLSLYIILRCREFFIYSGYKSLIKYRILIYFLPSRKSVTISTWFSFWTLNSASLIYLSVLVLVPHCLNYHCFVISVKIRKWTSSYLILFQNCSGCSASPAVPYEFWNQVAR